jgi:hypothetical protein
MVPDVWEGLERSLGEKWPLLTAAAAAAALPYLSSCSAARYMRISKIDSFLHLKVSLVKSFLL